MVRLNTLHPKVVAEKALMIDYIYHESTPREVRSINKDFTLEVTNEDGTEETILDIEWMLLVCPFPEVKRMAELIAINKSKEVKKQSTIMSIEDLKIQDELAKRKQNGDSGLITP